MMAAYARYPVMHLKDSSPSRPRESAITRRLGQGNIARNMPKYADRPACTRKHVKKPLAAASAQRAAVVIDAERPAAQLRAAADAQDLLGKFRRHLDHR